MADNRTSYQIPYYPLDVPLNPAPLPSEYSSLHTLYPGEPMINRDTAFNRYYIPHCDPEGARCAFVENKENTIIAAQRLEALARKSGGNPEDKVTIHAVADPSTIVEDPALSQLSTQAPIALNDGMQFVATPNSRRENFREEKEVEVPNKNLSKSSIERFRAGADKEDGGMIYVLVFIGFIVLCLLLAGAFLGPRKRAIR